MMNRGGESANHPRFLRNKGKDGQESRGWFVCVCHRNSQKSHKPVLKLKTPITDLGKNTKQKNKAYRLPVHFIFHTFHGYIQSAQRGQEKKRRMK